MDTQIILAGLWIALMLTFLLGDVLRIFAGDFQPGKIIGKKMTQPLWLLIAIMMVTPIVMVIITLLLDQPINRMVNIIVAAAWFLFNLVGLPSYPTYYDRFLIVVGLAINILTIWYAFHWA